jgi:Pvc16 N-terminal domain
MPLLDLSLVTKTLLNLIDKHINSLPSAEKAKLSSLWTVSPLPPDRLTGDHAIGVYLYHAVEDPYRKNLAPPGQDFPPVALTPMGLHLYYQVSAHSDAHTDIGTENEQTLMGFAIKGLHDHPVVDATTQIGGVTIFPPDLRDTDNRFIIDLLPIQADQALQYWTPGSSAARFAAYYKVSVTLLEPEPARSRSGRVLLYGVYSFVGGSPRLDSSKSEVVFRIPSESADRTAVVQPAEAAVGGTISFSGSNLAGDSTTLLIKNARLAEPIEVGNDWGVLANDSEIRIVVQPNLGTLPTFPGVYSAVAKVTETRRMPDNSVRAFPKTSNEVPFIVTPTVVLVLPTSAAPDTFTVNGGIFKDLTLPQSSPPLPGNVEPRGSVQVFVGPNSLVPKDEIPPAPSLAPGEFELTGASQLQFRLPAGTNSHDVLLFRVLVNGAESAPSWITVP